MGRLEDERLLPVVTPCLDDTRACPEPMDEYRLKATDGPYLRRSAVTRICDLAVRVVYALAPPEQPFAFHVPTMDRWVFLETSLRDFPVTEVLDKDWDSHSKLYIQHVRAGFLPEQIAFVKEYAADPARYAARNPVVWPEEVAQRVKKWEKLIADEVPPACTPEQAKAWFAAHGLGKDKYLWVRYFTNTTRERLRGKTPAARAGLNDTDLGGMVQGFVMCPDVKVNRGFYARLNIYFFFNKQGHCVGHLVYPPYFGE